MQKGHLFGDGLLNRRTFFRNGDTSPMEAAYQFNRLESDKFEASQAQGLLVECECATATRPCIKGSDEAISERTPPAAKRDHRKEDLLLILNHQRIRLQQAFNRIGDFRIGQTVYASKHPNGLNHGYDIYKTRLIPAQ
jgi:hypothetical protein